MAYPGAAPAAAPALEAVFPAGARSGSTTEVELVGNFDPWPCQLWCSRDDVHLEPVPDQQGRVTVRVDPDAPPAPCLVRAFNAEGCSEPRAFVVGDVSEVLETHETNNRFGSPQPITGPFPLVVNGRLGKRGEADFYSVRLEPGTRLVASIVSNQIGAPIDPHLVLFRPDGSRLALGNDSPSGLDPALEFSPETGGDRNQEFVLGVMGFAHPPRADISFGGDEEAVYRLHLGTARGTDAPSPRPPDSTGQGPAPATPPFTVTRTLPPDGEPDRIRLASLTPDQPLAISISTTDLEPAPTASIDAVLEIRDASGKEFAAKDDSGGSPDPSLTWTPPAEAGGSGYQLLVYDRFKRGGPGFTYRLDVRPRTPSVRATAAASQLTLTPGGESEMKISIKRSGGHDAPLSVDVDGLPNTVTAESTPVPDDDGDVTVTLRAAPDAQPSSSPLQVRLVPNAAAEDTPGPDTGTTAVFALPTEAPAGPLLIPETDTLWLTVTAPPQSS